MIERSIMPAVTFVAEMEASRVVNEALVCAVNNHVVDFLTGRRLIETNLTESGELLYIRTKTDDLNRIQAEALDALQGAFASLERFSVHVPLGHALGSKIFAAYGPKIKVVLCPHGSIEVKVMDSFEVTGINQVKYHVYLEVEGVVKIVVPLLSSLVPVKTTIPLATLLIPGKVPHTYINIPGS